MVGYSLERSPSCCRGNTDTNNHLHSHSHVWVIKVGSWPDLCVCMGCGRKLECSKKKKIFMQQINSYTEPACSKMMVLTTIVPPVYFYIGWNVKKFLLMSASCFPPGEHLQLSFYMSRWVFFLSLFCLQGK